MARSKALCVDAVREAATLYKERAACLSTSGGACAGPTAVSASGGTGAGAVGVGSGGSEGGVIIS